MTIDAYTRSAADLFGKAVSLEIPPFQRAYVWQRDKHWAPLWDDIADLAEAVLEATNDGAEQLADDEGPTHFLGAVVLHHQSGQLGGIPVYRVIDGQQRLTTWQLLLHAAKDVYAERDLDDADDLADLVHNKTKKKRGQTQQELKIVPTRADRAHFLRAMRGETSSNDRDDSLIALAHDYFRGQVSDWLANDADNVSIRAEALYQALALLLQVVVIDLDNNADPQIIFETLNARGEPLLQSDLVKNYVIFIAEQEGNDAEIVADEWLGRYDDGWWRVEVPQGRLRRQRIEQFLNYWLVMREAAEVPAGDVFRTFQKHVAESSSSMRDTVQAMNDSSEHYRHVINIPSASTIASQLTHFKILEAGVVTPVILWLMANVPQDRAEVTERAVRALESYYVRRVLCGRTSMGLNRVMHEVLDRLNQADAGSADGVVVKHLRDQTVDRRAWPTDSLVGTTLLERGIYSMARPKLAMVLEAIAHRIASKEPKDDPVDYSSLTIEHVMPQKWRGEDWTPPTNGFVQSGETPESARDRIIHTIGNLTLVTQPLNSALSNNPWSDKRTEIEGHSLTTINRDLVEHAGDVWDEATILARSQRLADIAIQIWPGPDAI